MELSLANWTGKQGRIFRRHVKFLFKSTIRFLCLFLMCHDIKKSTPQWASLQAFDKCETIYLVKSAQ